MVRLMLAAAGCALAVGTAAQAQSVDVSGSASSVTTLNGVPGPAVPGTGVASGLGGASFYTSFFSIDSQFITFESGNVLTGLSAATTSVSRIDMTLSNL